MLEETVRRAGVSELRELRQLRDENGRLKRLVADLSLDRQILQGDRVKKAVKPGLRRKLGRWAQQTYQIGQRRTARLMKVGWSTWLYRRKVRRFEEMLRRCVCEMAATYVRYGYRRLTVLLRREGWKVIAKRIYRLYAEEQLIVRTKLRKKIGRRQRLAAPMAVEANVCWSMDFVSSRPQCIRRLNHLTTDRRGFWRVYWTCPSAGAELIHP